MKRNIYNIQLKNDKVEVDAGNRKYIKITVLVLLALSLFFPIGALADDDHRRKGHKERFVLDFGDQQFSSYHGEPSTLYLKKALRRQYPYVNVSDYRLRKVVLVAKTYYGRGNAQLRVGPEMTDLYRVGGHPHQFDRKKRNSFDKVRIHNPFRDSWGPWQLYLRGNFKVRKVVLVVEKRHQSHYGWSHNDYPERHYYDWRSDDGRFYFNMRWY